MTKSHPHPVEGFPPETLKHHPKTISVTILHDIIDKSTVSILKDKEKEKP